MLSVVVDERARAELTTDLDELFREGARRMLAAALEAEVEAYIATHAELVDARGHRLVVCNGHAPARTITTGAGQVEVVRPRVDDRRVDAATGEGVQFSSVLLPRWCRRSPKVAEVLPLLYLHGLCFFDFPAQHWLHLRTTDESFKAGVALSAGWDGVSLLGRAWSTPERRAGSWGWEPCRAACPLRAQRRAPVVAATPLAIGSSSGLARRPLGLPAGDELAVGSFGLLGERPLAPADLLEGIGGSRALLPAPGRHAGAQLQRPQLLVGQRRTGEGVVLLADHQVPAQRGELAGGGHHGDLHAAPGADAFVEGTQRPGGLGRGPGGLH